MRWCLPCRFLSEDEYRFDFVQAQTSSGLQRYLDLHGDEKSGFDPERIILFSGGLDSLAGAAEALLRGGQRVALVSHQSSPLIRSKQLNLASELRSRVQPGQLFQVSVAVNKGTENATEFTQRVRSFLFATLGFVVARLFRKGEICFFENGVLSMNLPIAEHVLGARATRTTHPRVLHEIGQLFSLLAEEPIQVANPYFWLTKTDVLGRLAKLGCHDLLPMSFSCTRVRQATRQKQHCGICSQCVDRRFAVLAARLEFHEPKEMYSIDLFDSPREPGPELTLAVSYVLSARRWASMTETAFLTNYGQVFRALPYLPGDISENASKLHQLHVRHGKSIVSVCNKAIRASASLEGALSVDETSLLAMIHYPIVRQPVRDVTETAPPASQQAAASSPTGLERPIQFAVDEKLNQIVFCGGVTLKGANFKLFMALYSEFLADRDGNRRPENCRYVKASDIADRMDVDEEAVRQTVSRTRQALRRKFLERYGNGLAEDDVIQTHGSKGYRLNPYLIPSTPALIRAARTNAT